MPVVLALDIAFKTGWAVTSGNHPGWPLSGTREISGSSINPGAAGSDLERFAYRKCLDFGVTHIAAEAPIYQSKHGKIIVDRNTALPLIGMFFTASVVAHKLKIHFLETSVLAVRKHFGGSAYCGKEGIQARCDQLNWEYVDDNAADAIGLWAYTMARLDPSWRPEQGEG